VHDALRNALSIEWALLLEALMVSVSRGPRGPAVRLF
jgi:hypothetical protein